MRSSLLTLVCVVVSVWNAFAQDQVARAKYEIIRETINFLAADKVVSQDTNFRVSCETMDYDCFKQQLSSKPIAGIERWYNSWRSMSASDEAGLVALRNQVFADIFERQGKGYRKQLPGYQSYVSRVESLLDLTVTHPPVEEIDGDDIAESVLSPAELHPTPIEQHTNQNEPSKKENTMIAYIALVIAVIALVIVTRLLFANKNNTDRQPTGFQELHGRLAELSNRMERLEVRSADAQISDAIASLTAIMESVEKRVVELENDAKRGMDE